MQKNAHVVSIDDYEDVPVNNEEALQKAIANQPVAVAIEAGGREFQLYDSVICLTQSDLIYVIMRIYKCYLMALLTKSCFCPKWILVLRIEFYVIGFFFFNSWPD